MSSPSTPTTRRAQWGDDARDLVTRLRAEAGTDGAWRTAYIAGFQLAKTTSTHITIMGACRSPHEQDPIHIPIEGPVPGDVTDKLCWTYDQDVARFIERENGDVPDPLPAGPLLVDRYTAVTLARIGIDEVRLRSMVEGEAARRSARTRITVGNWPATIEMSIAFDMNAVLTHFDVPGGGKWAAGTLIIDLPPIPETLRIAARGRSVGDLIDHSLALAAPEVKITSVTHGPGRRTMINTNATTRENMVGIPNRTDVQPGQWRNAA